MVKELMFVCPTCFAGIGAPCNTPTETGRRDVRWFHCSRENRAIGWTNTDDQS